jgi:hypothetical protein
MEGLFENTGRRRPRKVWTSGIGARNGDGAHVGATLRPRPDINEADLASAPFASMRRRADANPVSRALESR